ncbi:hypothetical protein [Nocardia sp. NPDC049526]|uniref:hypothetical protein n=1 Tax=Nocardia sp. NPDC049526 TaxID=3364316 RepID=UPI0037B7C366
MDHEYESALEEKPLEFLTSIANSGGSCDGQAIVPDGEHYRCWCSCGEWTIQAPTQREGLRLARAHTGSTPI